MRKLIWLKPDQFRCAANLALIAFLVVACNEATEFQQKEQGFAKRVSAETDATKSYSYPAALVAEGEMTWDMAEGRVSHSLALVKGPATFTNHRQVERQLHEELIDQGHDGASAAEPYSMKQTGQLDILIVMDNSGTMQDYQELVSARLDQILSEVSNTNWRVAVVTTDDPCVKGTVSRVDFDRDEAAATADFAALVKVGIAGDNHERGLEMAIGGFKQNPACANANNWTRQHSIKAVLLVSDEANCGSAEVAIRDVNGNIIGSELERVACTDGTFPNITTQDFLDQTPPGTRFYGLLHEENTCAASSGFPVQPDEYYQLAVDTGGLWRPICSPDYDAVLSEISADVGDMLVREFDLAAVPDAGTFIALIDGVDQTQLFQRKGKKVSLAGNPPGNPQTIEFIYRHGAKQRFSAHTIANEADEKTIQVKVNGNLVAKSSYIFDELNGTIDFVDVPEDKAKVSIKYRAAGKLGNKFEAPEEFWGESLKVLVGGELFESEFIIDKENNQVVFANPPEDGVDMVFVSRKESDYQLDYELPAKDLLDVREVVVSGEGKELAHDVVLTDGQLSFDMKDVDSLSEVSIVYYLEQDATDFVVSLPAEPLDGSLKVETGDEDLAKCVESIAIRENVVDASCLANSNTDAEKVTLKFNYVVEYFEDYILDEEIDSDQAISVFVDNIEVDFTRVGRVVSIDAGILEPNSIVDIVLLDY